MRERKRREVARRRPQRSLAPSVAELALPLPVVEETKEQKCLAPGFDTATRGGWEWAEGHWRDDISAVGFNYVM